MPLPNEPFDPQRPTADSGFAVTPHSATVNFVFPKQSTGNKASTPATPPNAPTIPGYRITAEIARGGMGRVYAAFDETLDREVVIKTLLPGADAERFITEVKITAKLPHPGILPVHALGTFDDGTPWLATKLIRGQTLAKLLQSRDREGADNRRADVLRSPSDRNASGQRELPGETPHHTALGSIPAAILTGNPAFVARSSWKRFRNSPRLTWPTR